eukprot:COSAG05_NODE_649_length_8102_cov_157.470823_11_plen_66_part_00
MGGAGKNRYRNQSQIMDVVRGHLDRGYPISLIIIDYFSWAPSPLGDETLPAECWCVFHLNAPAIC